MNPRPDDEEAARLYTAWLGRVRAAVHRAHTQANRQRPPSTNPAPGTPHAAAQRAREQLTQALHYHRRGEHQHALRLLQAALTTAKLAATATRHPVNLPPPTTREDPEGRYPDIPHPRR